MARFYAEIQGNRGNATRMGTASSGMTGHIRGWNLGARVELDVDPVTGADRLMVYLTTGSNGGRPDNLIWTEIAPRGED